MIVGVAVAIAGLIAFDHVGLMGGTGNDWSQFDKRLFPVARVISGDEIIVRANDRDVIVRLLGIDAPDAGLAGHVEAVAYAQRRLAGHTVTLRLEPTQTRDAAGELLAYVFVTDGDDLNLDMIHDAKAYADRRVKHTLSGPFEQAESEARKKSRGLWDGLRDDEQPVWRREWLKAFFAERKAATRATVK